MPIHNWEHFFKPEVKSSARSLITQGKVIPSRLSDTEIQSYIRTSTAVKVILNCQKIESNTVFVFCNCPLFKKGQFCKHIWAVLIVANEKFSDFFDSKTELEKKVQDFVEPTKSAQSQKQAEYRKEQYQKQKQRLKDQKKSKRSSLVIKEFPISVELALKYFYENGFDLKESMNAETIGFAKKKLSRVFHPDVGGSHEEIQELNKFAETLINYSK